MDCYYSEGIDYWYEQAEETLGGCFPSNTSFISFKTELNIEELIKSLQLLDLYYQPISKGLTYIKTTPMKNGKFNHVFKRN
jgi:hypothetical protein